MQYGFAFECFVKSKLIKEKALNIFDGKNEYKLSIDICKHVDIDFYNKYKSFLPVVCEDEIKYIKNLNRAVLSGKYPFEKIPTPFSTYTSYFEETIVFCRKILKKLN